MRIFMINSVCGSGSTGRIVTDLSEILKKKGHEVRVGYGVGHATRISEKYTFKNSNRIDYYVHNAFSRLTDRAGFYSVAATKKLICDIEEFSPDIIHLHNLHGYYLNIRLLFEYLVKVNLPVIWTLHDCWSLTGHCVHFSYIHCLKWMDLCCYCPQKHAYPKTYIMDNARRNYEEKRKLFCSVKNMTLVTPSDWLASVVRQSYLKKYDVKVIPNGIDTDIFKPVSGEFKKKYHIENKQMVLAVANVWIGKKGFYDVLEIAQRLDSEQFQVVMVGVSKKQLENLPKSILPIIRTNAIDELVDIYSSADVFINPSYEETMGMVTVEALACGTPCFVYNKTAVPEVVDEWSGKVFCAGDIESMCKSISQKEYLTFKRMRERALYFEKRKEYNKYIDLYTSEVCNIGRKENE